LLSFPRNAHGNGTAALRVDRRPVETKSPIVTSEELFVIDKYTGFNRFRGKFRKQSPAVDTATSLSRTEAKALL
jgi:hypothetical protein